MRIAQIIGSVTLSRAHPSLPANQLRLAIPYTLDELAQDTPPQSDTLVVVDQLHAGLGDKILLSEGAEAAQPFRPEIRPVDAYNAGILDDITLNIS